MSKRSKVQKRKSGRRHTRKHHRGGSQASGLVSSFTNTAGEFKTMPETPRLPGNPAGLNLYQTTGGAKPLRGGSPASDYVMARAQYVLDEANKLGSQQTGGRRRKSKKSKKSKKTKKSKRTKSKRRHMGGGSATDFRDTLYSRVVNGGRTDDVPFFNAFTNEEYISQQDLANEPNMVANPPYLQ